MHVEALSYTVRGTSFKGICFTIHLSFAQELTLLPVKYKTNLPLNSVFCMSSILTWLTVLVLQHMVE